MENVTKIDIIGQNIYCYNEISNERKDYILDKNCGEFINEFSDTQDLLSINISDPIKRIIKFYEIVESIPASFEELEYESMSLNQKNIFDYFIQLIKSKSED